MRKRIVAGTAILAVISGGVILHFIISARQEARSDATFQDEPEAHALYDKMIEAMRHAQSLSYRSEYRLEAKGTGPEPCTYTVWMKKPNYFRVESTAANGEERGTLVGDGDFLWIYWAKKRPFFSHEDSNDYERTCTNVYMTEATPPGKHSIGHKTGLLGGGLGMTIIDPSTFHGYTDSLQPYIDGVRSLGTETVGEAECDVIEVSFMKGQRSWYLWLSKKDRLARKLKQVVHVSYDIIFHELWSNVTVDGEIPTEKFVWSPPEGWQQWRMPDPEEMLLKAGQQAPDFNLRLANGRPTKLSDYRGKIVWFYIWRAG
ncbi:MAG TPA: hypothetical protein VMW16_04035 [Sedimentisphaerales bacterium]|nr:hypothetical protein [Sedimentisphaerales bacterium]